MSRQHCHLTIGRCDELKEEIQIPNSPIQYQTARSRSECDIRENFDINEYPNIFLYKNLPERISEYIHIKNLTRTNVRINVCIENCANIRLVFILLHNHKRMSKYIHIKNLTRTNV